MVRKRQCVKQKFLGLSVRLSVGSSTQILIREELQTVGFSTSRSQWLEVEVAQAEAAVYRYGNAGDIESSEIKSWRRIPD